MNVFIVCLADKFLKDPSYTPYKLEPQLNKNEFLFDTKKFVLYFECRFLELFIQFLINSVIFLLLEHFMIPKCLFLCQLFP